MLIHTKRRPLEIFLLSPSSEVRLDVANRLSLFACCVGGVSFPVAAHRLRLAAEELENAVSLVTAHGRT